MSTPDMEGRIDQDFDPPETQIPEADTVGVAEQPGRFMVGGVGTPIQSTDPECYRHLLAMITESGTGWGLMHLPNLALSLFRVRGLMFVNLFTRSLSLFPASGGGS